MHVGLYVIVYNLRIAALFNGWRTFELISVY